MGARQPVPRIEDFPVSIEGLIRKDSHTLDLFRTLLRAHGAAVLVQTNTEDFSEGLATSFRSYHDVCEGFFSQDIPSKQAFKAKCTDELLASLGRVPNQGYVLTPGKKEYFKARLKPQRDEHIPFPTDYDISFREKFIDYAHRMRYLSEVCFNAAVDGTSMAANVRESVLSLCSEDSSISVIQYFPSHENDPIQQNSIPLSEHVDTGVLTLLTPSKTSGLEIEDRLNKTWLRPEEFPCVREALRKGQAVLICMLGSKMTSFLSAYDTEPEYFPCLHRVSIPPKTTRLCSLYFMSLGKEA